MNHPSRLPRTAARKAARPAGAILTLLALALMPQPAHAHGIGGEAADRSVLGFIPLGIEHMLLGWDHLLFIAGVVLLAGEWRRAAKMITIFVVGHSATLITATLAGWQVDAGFVDMVIALSVVFVGALGLFVGRVRSWTVFGYVVLAFGLIHGLGLSTRLQALGLPEEGVLWRVIAFNVGIEIGQLTAIMGMVAIAALVRTATSRTRDDLFKKVAAAGMFIGGSVATALLAFQVATGDEVVVEVAEDGEADCSVEERTETFPGMGGHAAKNFYGPDEEAPMGDFGHSLGDGYVVVLYPSSLEEGAVDDLQAFVTGPEGSGVLAGPDPESTEQVKAINAHQTLTCDQFDLESIEDFKTDWFEQITS